MAAIELLGTQKHLVVGALLPAFVALWLWGPHKTRARAPLPPGPKGLPLIGNLLQIPVTRPWEVYQEWKKQYGDIIYLEALGQRVLVLNSLESIQDLLVSRAPNYSDRPDGALLDLAKVRSTSFAVGMNYGQPWREHRRDFHRFYNHTQMHRFHPIIEEEISVFLSRLLDNPSGFHEEIHMALGMIIMRGSYGGEDPEYNKRLATSAATIADGFVTYSAPGRLLVSIFPSLRHVPSWFPGAGWKRILQHLGDLTEQIFNEPFDAVEGRMKAGQESEYVNVARELLESLPERDLDEHAYAHRRLVARNVAAQAYIAGIDTTFSATSALCLALAINPDVQRKAQVELEAVVGSHRLPNARDLENLPYIQAIIKEGARWHTVVPLSLPRATAGEDVYKGFRIPAKTLILPNAWAIMHDPEVFEDPLEFRPERYLKDGKMNPDVLDPADVAFGFGRRICPGRHMGNTIISVVFASLLACFDIKPAKDKDGQPMPLRQRVSSSLNTAPLPHEWEIKPRSEKHIALLRR
ncbi:cytochrome P450 98A3 [Coprinopsis sp. MPI-PUGE-AT-0042]|nr:cytochrome P450 98A3 [Coprinopsis sp. MPI-PUGE-AT-0042]KAH6916315.1 cytochrome P450 98A3 [Coprinopsis sp. MPI-PUGE-AT-0042]